MKKMLLLSNSTISGESYLAYARDEIQNFLGDKIKTALFIPYAAVTISFDEYELKVKTVFAQIGIDVKSIHHDQDPNEAIIKAESIIVGGGNTWQLVRIMHDKGLTISIRKRVEQNIPYIGWSAGANVACPSLRTTNDMPIIDPIGFDCINLIPFQINPHYLHGNPPDHGGETREDRIQEFSILNPKIYTVGLREGTMFKIVDQTIELIGNRPCRIFKHGIAPYELNSENDFSFLL